MTSDSRQRAQQRSIKKVAILFSGGPAPAANAVISTAAVSFLRHRIDVIGILRGYSSLQEYRPGRPLERDRDYIEIDHRTLRRTRNSQGILLGTARANPGARISQVSDLTNAQQTEPLRRTYEALRSLEVDALISIGGDDTLKTANKFKLFQGTLPAGMPRMPVVHLPKTIDNDYSGIDFTFGYFTAVDMLATEIRNLLYDAQAGRAYYLAETMGRSAGWLAYGAAIAGEASMVISVEDISGDLESRERVVDNKSGRKHGRRVMNVDAVVGRIVEMILRREAERKDYGVIVMAEGLAELLPQAMLEGIPRDQHGHLAVMHVGLGRRFAELVAQQYKSQTGRQCKITGLQLGYEARCAAPHAFDVILGSQLGVGAYRALIEEQLDGVMVSVSGQFALRYVPFEKLVDQKTLVTKVRRIQRDSDFHRLARFLETYNQ